MKHNLLLKFSFIGLVLCFSTTLSAQSQNESPAQKCEVPDEILERLKKNNFLEVASDEIAVYGDVRQPQKLKFVSQMTLFTALGTVGGVNPKSHQRLVIFKKINGSDGEFEKKIIDLKLIKSGKERDFILNGGEIIYVSFRCAGRFANLPKDFLRLVDSPLPIPKSYKPFK